MISASHNLYHDNRIKILNHLREKMDEETIEKIEAYLDSDEDISFAVEKKSEEVLTMLQEEIDLFDI